MKKTVSVSIDEGILADAKERAWNERKSMSQFIEDMISLMSGMNHIEKCWYCEKVHDLRIACPEYVSLQENRVKDRDPVKANDAMSSFFKPQPKLKDKAKK